MKNVLITTLIALGLVACEPDGNGNNHDHSGHSHTDGNHDHDHEHADGDGDGKASDDQGGDGDKKKTGLFEGEKIDGWNHFGDGVHAGEAVEVAAIFADPSKFPADKPVRIEGPIDSVCQAKGCWVRLGTEDENVFVKFKDYGFFLPTDAEGVARLEGFVKVEEMTVAQQKHYLEDEGKHEEAAKITEPVRKVTFLAHGAAIKNAE